MRVALALLAAVPTLALAQPEAKPAADEGVDLTAAASKLEGEVGALPGTEVQLEPGAGGESHTVQRGDTLWDLSAKYLQDPYAWPKIWSWNPEIANPHWIYPGNVIRLGKDGKLVVTPGPLADPGPADDSDLVQPPQELADFSKADMQKPSELGEGDEVNVAADRKIGFTQTKGVLARRDSFVTRGELDESGVLSASFEDKLLLTVHDRAYAKFRGAAPVKPGQTYAIFETDRELRHPATGQLFGYRTTVLGAAKVVAVDAKAATLQIVAATAPIMRGTYLAPWPARATNEVVRRPNRKAVAGTLVGAEVSVVTEIAEHHVVYVDRGTKDGVEEGNVFTVLRSGDPYGREMARATSDARLPTEDIGALLVVEAKEHASTALVIRSARELVIGDRVELRVAPTPVAGAASN